MNAIDRLPAFVGQGCSFQSVETRAAVSDMRRRHPRMDDLSDFGISEHLGPWRITKEGDIFHWQLADEPSINERGAWDMSRRTISGDKGDRMRVILVGESAAGSFGYWDEGTLAKQIGMRLARSSDRFEVIDLSCVNASMELCIEIMKHAVTLDPDYFILYSANNEGKSLLENFDNGELNASMPSSVRWSFLSRPSLDGYGAEMVKALAEHSVQQLARASSIAGHFGVGLVYVLPESNAWDWAPQEKIAFALTGKEVLAAWSAEPSELGEGCRYPSQLAAWHAARALQHTDPLAAMDLYDVARELGVGAFVNAVPQTVGSVAKSLRKHCRSEGIECVDMPALFRAGEVGRWPDRHHFIDYCHLSLDGIALLADACAASICRLHGQELPPAGLSNAPAISAREQFLGAMIGAIHSYHYGQPNDIVAHWIKEALQSEWPFAREFLTLLRTFLLERARETLTPARLESNKAFAELPDRYKLFFLKFAYHGRFDRQLYQLLDTATGEQTLSNHLRERKDDLLAFQGDLYSLFYLDCHKGVRPRLRGSNRTGWERPDLEFLIDSPEFEVDIPPTAFEYDAIEMGLELEGVHGGTLTCEFDGFTLGQQALHEGCSNHVFPLAPHHADRHGHLRSLRFRIDHMVGLADRQGTEQRYRQLGRFGWYPCGGRITKLRLRPPGLDHAAAAFGETHQ